MYSSARKSSYRFGIVAEYLAAAFLLLKGYRILALRYRNHGGEIDIIAKKRKLVALVEVKARKRMEDCLHSITQQKQQRMQAAAQFMLGQARNVYGLEDLPICSIRFDVIWVVPWRLPVHIKDAWR